MAQVKSVWPCRLNPLDFSLSHSQNPYSGYRLMHERMHAALFT